MSVPPASNPYLPDDGQTVRESVPLEERAPHKGSASERQAHLLVSGAQDYAIYMMDAQGTILTHNPGVERVLGYREEEWVGQHTSVIFTPEDRASGEDRRELENSAANGRAEDIRWHVRRDGSRIWADGVVTPLYDEAGTLVGFGKIMRDATERKRAQTALLDAEERLRLAAEATGVGTFDFNPVSGELRWDERLKALFGLPPEAHVNYDVFLAVTHTDDRERAHGVVMRALDPNSGADGEYSVEFRPDRTDDGRERWVLARGRAFFDPARTHAIRFVGTVIDITERKRAEDALRVSAEALRASEERLSSVIGTAMDGILIASEDQRIVSANPAAQEMFGYAQDEVIGAPLNVLMPERFRVAHGGHIQRFEASGLTRRTRESFGVLTARHRNGTEFPIEASVSRFQGSDGRTLFAAFVRDISERMRAETALRDSERRFRALVDASSQIVWTNSPEGKMEGEQPGWGEFTGQTFDEYQGFGWAEAVHPDDRQPSVDEWNRCVKERIPFVWEHRVRRRDGIYRTFSIRAVPVLNDDGTICEWVGIHTDITEQRASEAEREALFLREQKRARQLRRLAEASLAINSTASLPEMFQVICDTAREIIGAHQSVVSITRGEDGAQAINAVSLSDRYAQWRDYAQMPEPSGIWAPVCRENRVVRLAQAELEVHPAWPGFDERTVEHPPMNGWLAVPLVARDGTNLGLIQLSDRYEGEFSENDEALLVQLSQLASVAIENQRLLDEERRRAEREALLNQIGDGIRQSLPPEQIEALAVTALGKALAADRCYLFTADVARDALVVARDWRAEGLPSLVGHYGLSEMGIDVDAVFGTGETLVVGHMQGDEERLSGENASVNQGLQVSSLINVPFYEEGRFVGALGVAMARGARQWTNEEVTLAETVAGQLRSTVEAARLQQRERNIAEQLQEALQPQPPPSLPGLALASFYRPALAEARVGGDAYDVFPVEKGCTALCVFDLSGKGLRAASAVATVRNMTRFALYNGPSVSAAIATLHRTLVEHDLLEGFATLFLGVYDHNQRTLTYVNAGQEPALIWRRVTGGIEQLPPTGPVLGGFDGSFSEAMVALAPEDVLAAFTDGLTDVGPNRMRLLGVEGVAALLRDCCNARATQASDPQAVVDCLIAGVDAFGQGRTGDDIALLVGVVGLCNDGQDNGQAEMAWEHQR